MGQGFSIATLTAGSAGIDVPELSDLVYEKTLGSARFMKSIRARHADGVVLVKVAVKPYPIDLRKIKKKIIRRSSKDLLWARKLMCMCRGAQGSCGRPECFGLSAYPRDRDEWVSGSTVPLQLFVRSHEYAPFLGGYRKEMAGFPTAMRCAGLPCTRYFPWRHQDRECAGYVVELAVSHRLLRIVQADNSPRRRSGGVLILLRYSRTTNMLPGT